MMSSARPLKCDECGIEEGWPCSYLDPQCDAIHAEDKHETCTLAAATAAGWVVALVPKADLDRPTCTICGEVIDHGVGMVPSGSQAFYVPAEFWRGYDHTSCYLAARRA